VPRRHLLFDKSFGSTNFFFALTDMESTSFSFLNLCLEINAMTICHRYFSALFNNKMKEAGKTEIEIRLEPPFDYFIDLVRFLISLLSGDNESFWHLDSIYVHWHLSNSIG
jgi:hypothetical protein